MTSYFKPNLVIVTQVESCYGAVSAVQLCEILLYVNDLLVILLYFNVMQNDFK